MSPESDSCQRYSDSLVSMCNSSQLAGATMNDELRKKILKSIDSTGFPHELRVITQLGRRGYHVSPNLHFHDRSGGEHEIDVFGINVRNDPAERMLCRGPIDLGLVVECKKSSVPWVFFEDAWDPFQQTGLRSLVTRLKCFTDLATKEDVRLVTGCMNTPLVSHHFNAEVPTARTYFEAFKHEKNVPSDIFRGAASVCYAQDFCERWFTKTNPGQHGRPNLDRTLMLHGVIVLHGSLVLATCADESISVNDVDHVLLRVVDCFTKTTGSPMPDNEVVIDVVTSNYFERYLEICDRDLRRFVDHVEALIRSGWIMTASGANVPAPTATENGA